MNSDEKDFWALRIELIQSMERWRKNVTDLYMAQDLRSNLYESRKLTQQASRGARRGTQATPSH